MTINKVAQTFAPHCTRNGKNRTKQYFSETKHFQSFNNYLPGNMIMNFLSQFAYEKERILIRLGFLGPLDFM